MIKLNALARQFSAELAKQREAAIKDALPHLFDMSKAERRIMPDGSEVLLYDGEPILEFHPVAIENGLGENAFMVRVSQKYRVITPTPSPASGSPARLPRAADDR